MPREYRLRLSKTERQALLAVATTGHRSTRVVVRAQVLLKSAEGWTEQQLAVAFAISPRTIRRLRRHAGQVGVLAALDEKPRAGAPRKLTAEEEARLVALACSPLPAGHCRWTVRLLTEEAIERGLIRSVVAETVRQVLQKTRPNRGTSRAGVRPRSRPSFSTP